MMIYRRNNYNKLCALRILFFALSAGSYFSFHYQQIILGYFLIIVMMATSLISFKNIIVTTQSFMVSKYYFFGLIKRSCQFGKQDDLKITAYGLDFGQDAEKDNLGSDTEEFGCLYSFIAVFAKSKVTEREYRIEQLNEINDTIKSVRVFLNKTEWNYLNTFVN